MGCCSTKIEREEKKHLNHFLSYYKKNKIKLSLQNQESIKLHLKIDNNANLKKLSKNHSVRKNFIEELVEFIEEDYLQKPNFLVKSDKYFFILDLQFLILHKTFIF